AHDGRGRARVLEAARDRGAARGSRALARTWWIRRGGNDGAGSTTARAGADRGPVRAPEGDHARRAPPRAARARTMSVGAAQSAVQIERRYLALDPRIRAKRATLEARNEVSHAAASALRERVAELRDELTRKKSRLEWETAE